MGEEMNSLERPKIENYLSEGTTTDMVNNMFLENPELYDYLNALEKYVDELEGDVGGTGIKENQGE